jgi:integrase
LYNQFLGVCWCSIRVERFIYFNNKRHPKDTGAKEVENFLNYLANSRHCSINTQRTALNALVYLYRKFLGVDIGQLNFAPARAPKRLPVVYSRKEIALIFSHMRGVHLLQSELMYGTGLRQAELLSLRIKDLDFDSFNIVVRSGKGNKDRTTMLPERLVPSLTGC